MAGPAPSAVASALVRLLSLPSFWTDIEVTLFETLAGFGIGALSAIAVGGLVLGIVAHRAGGSDGGRNGWQTSAVSHMAANIIATCIALAAGAL
mgnify:CR=1 FL=1